MRVFKIDKYTFKFQKSATKSASKQGGKAARVQSQPASTSAAASNLPSVKEEEPRVIGVLVSDACPPEWDIASAGAERR